MAKMMSPTKVITGPKTRFSYLNANEPKKQTYSYEIPINGKWNPSHLSIVAFVYNDNGVEQAIKAKVINNE